MRSIDESLFAVCLSDESTQGNIEKEARCMLHGEARDRWLDKSFQLVVSRDGEAAINFEHAWGDGIAVVRIVIKKTRQDIYMPDLISSHRYDSQTRYMIL